jgi:hypothetical protein
LLQVFGPVIHYNSLIFFPGLVGYDSLCPLTSIPVVSLSIAYNRLSCFSCALVSGEYYGAVSIPDGIASNVQLVVNDESVRIWKELAIV